MASSVPLPPQVRYVFKPHFGELPPYLHQRKRELGEQRAAAERAKQPAPVGAGCAGSSGLEAACRTRAFENRAKVAL